MTSSNNSEQIDFKYSDYKKLKAQNTDLTDAEIETLMLEAYRKLEKNPTTVERVETQTEHVKSAEQAYGMSSSQARRFAGSIIASFVAIFAVLMTIVAFSVANIFVGPWFAALLSVITMLYTSGYFLHDIFAKRRAALKRKKHDAQENNDDERR